MHFIEKSIFTLMRKKYLILFIVLALAFNPLFLPAQHFEWAASGSNLLTGYSHSCVTPGGRLIAAGQYEQLSGSLGPGNTELYSGTGSSFPLYGRQTQFFISSFSPKGEMEWMLSGAKIANWCRMKGITVLPDGTVAVAFTSSGLNMPFIKTDLPPNDPDNAGSKDEYEKRLDESKRYLFIALINNKGRINEIYGVANAPRGEWNGFIATSDGGYIISNGDERNAIDVTGRKRDVWHNFTSKYNSSFKKQWEHKIMHLDSSCCIMFPGATVTEAGGDIYISGNFRNGARPDGGTDHFSPVVTKYKLGDDMVESYIARLSSEGKLKWIKYTGGKSLIRDMKTDGNRVIIGGIIMAHKDFMGKKIDTTNAKNAFLASLDANGNLLWVNTYNAKEITAVSLDGTGNIFAAFNSGRTIYDAPLRMGSEADTLADTNKRVVIGSYDADGKYRWYKKSRARLSEPSNMRLHNDGCGNLYLTAEMWYILPVVNMQIFDAAIVTGRGYGGAPLAAKVRTTIPDELLQQNQNIVTPRALDTVKQQKQNSCVAIPFPWKLKIFPNPTTGRFTVRATTSYSDNQVQLELRNILGGTIRQLMPPRKIDAGSFDQECDISNLPSGVYLVILRGTGGAATEQVVLAK